MSNESRFFTTFLSVLLLSLSVFASSFEYEDTFPTKSKPVQSSPQTYPPGIMFSTLLDNVKLLASDGTFRLNNQMQNVFMPDGAAGKVVVSNDGGAGFATWKWKHDGFGMKPPYKLFGFIQPSVDSNLLKLTKPGKLTADFFLDDKKFYTFPFSVRKVEPADPFDGNPIYLIDGDWQNWGYFYYADANPGANLAWKIWMRDDTHKHPSHKIDITVVRDSDKKLICRSRDNMTQNFRNDWNRKTYDLVNPPVKTSSGAYFKAQDLLAVDGGYTLTMKLDGEVYGIWKFEVSGGKFKTVGRSDRSAADPMTFIEGGKDAFWFERQK